MRVHGAKKNKNFTAEPTTANVNEPKKRIHNVFIIDASGSMRGEKYQNAIIGVNTLLNDIKNDPETINTAMVVEFEGKRIKTRQHLHESNNGTYSPMGTGGDTPLNQAVGETIEEVYNLRKNNYNEADKVLVNVFTDGGENASNGKYANAETLGAYIKSLESEGFTVTFVGTQREVNYAINTLNLAKSNTMTHTNTGASVAEAFGATIRSRQMYSKSVARGEDVTQNFYSKSVEEK